MARNELIITYMQGAKWVHKAPLQTLALCWVVTSKQGLLNPQERDSS